jgi:hypothetical protein
MASSGMLRRVALVRTDVSEELSAPVIRMTRTSELGTTLAVTSNRRTLGRNTNCTLYFWPRYHDPLYQRSEVTAGLKIITHIIYKNKLDGY